MYKQILMVASAISLLSLGACETTQFSGFSDAPMAQAGEFQHPRINGGHEPPEAHAEIANVLSPSCQRQDRAQAAQAGQTGFNGLVAGGITGGAGLAGGVTAAFNVPNPMNYGFEGAVTGGASGLYGGLNQGSSGNASTIGSCIRDFWNISKQYDPRFTAAKYKGTVVETIYVGKKWGKSSPPALDPNYVP